jgi:hypothetical protein
MNADRRDRLLENLQGPYLESSTEPPVLWCTVSTNCVISRQPPPPPAKFPGTGSNQEKVIFVGDVVNKNSVLYYTLLITMTVIVSSVNIGAVKLIGN